MWGLTDVSRSKSSTFSFGHLYVIAVYHSLGAIFDVNFHQERSSPQLLEAFGGKTRMDRQIQGVGSVFRRRKSRKTVRFQNLPLEVQRPLKEWVFTKDHYFSRDLLHQQFQGTDLF